MCRTPCSRPRAARRFITSIAPASRRFVTPCRMALLPRRPGDALRLRFDRSLCGFAGLRVVGPRPLAPALSPARGEVGLGSAEQLFHLLKEVARLRRDVFA